MFIAKKITISLTVLVLLSACASSPDKMTATDVSPLKYRQYDCEQIIMESDRISRKINTLYSQLKTKANNDTTQMAVGVVLFFPTLFFLEGGDGAEAVEYRQLKGEHEALQQISLQKKCNSDLTDIKGSL